MATARDILIRLRVVGGDAVKREMAGAANSTKALRGELNRIEADARTSSGKLVSGAQAAARAKREAAKAAREYRRNLEEASRAGAVMGGAMVAALGVAAKAAMDFDKALSGLKAVAGASADEMGRLRQAALDAGAATAFSASEAARAQAELAKAGVSVADILGGALTGTMSLAAAGQIELADAATIAAQAMNIFKLGGADVGHIADVLAAGANKSAADVGSLGDALRQGGLLAAQTGLSLEDTVATLSAFSDRALVGSDAGTSLKTMLQRLVPTSKEAAKLMDGLGIAAYDASGQFVGVAKLAGNLQTSLRGLTQQQRNAALATIFGSDAVRAANVLYELGEDGIRGYIGAVNDQGAASRNAATQLDNLSGDIEALRGSIETALIGSGSKATGVLRFMAQGATDAVNALGGLPGPLQSAGVGLAGVVGGGTLALGALGMLVPRVQEARKALEGLGAAGGVANRGIGLLGRVGGYAVGIAAVALATNQLLEAINRANNGTASLGKLNEALADLATSQALGGELTKQFGANMGNLGRKIDLTVQSGKAFSGKVFFAGFNEARDARKDIDALDKSLASLVQTGRGDVAARLFGDFKRQAREQGRSVADVESAFGDYMEATAASRAETKLAGDAAGRTTGQIDNLTESVGGLAATEAKVSDWAKGISGSIGGALDPAAAMLGVVNRTRTASEERLKGNLATAQKALEGLAPGTGSTEKVAAFRSEISRLQSQLTDVRKIFGRGSAKELSLLTSIEEQKRALAELPKDATEVARKAAELNVDKAKKALEELPNTVVGTLRDLRTGLEESIRDIEAWQTNLVALARRGRGDLARELGAMGPQSASLVAEAVKSSDAELAKLEGLFARRGALAGDAAAAAMEERLSLLSGIAQAKGEITVLTLARALGVAPTETRRIIDAVRAEMDKLPAHLRAEVEAVVNGMEALEGMVGVLKELSTIDRIVVTPEFVGPLGANTFRQLGPALPGRASGGYVQAGRTYRIGELGPEDITFGMAGYVTPNDRLAAATPGAAMPRTYVQSGGGLDNASFDRLDALAKQLARRPAPQISISHTQPIDPLHLAAEAAWQLR